MTDPIDPTDLKITAEFPLRFGHLSKFARSPAHYLEARSRDAVGVEQPTAAMEKGSAFHAVLTGTRAVVRYPGKVRSGKQMDCIRVRPQVPAAAERPTNGATATAAPETEHDDAEHDDADDDTSTDESEVAHD